MSCSSGNGSLMVGEAWNGNYSHILGFRIFLKLHSTPSRIYIGVIKTLQKIKQRFYWGKASKYVKHLSLSCDACTARNCSRAHGSGKLHQYNVEVIFERIALDILGSSPLTAKENKYILIFMVYFTKWLEA